MLNFEEAKAKAKKLKPSSDYCVEFENAYMFGAKAEYFSIGGDGPVFILKDGGRAVNSTYYYDELVTEVVKDEFDI